MFHDLIAKEYQENSGERMERVHTFEIKDLEMQVKTSRNIGLQYIE